MVSLGLSAAIGGLSYLAETLHLYKFNEGVAKVLLESCG